MTRSNVAAFRALHARDRLLVLPNSWDAASAAIARTAGAEAIATSSAAVAWGYGYPDGDALPYAERISAIRAVLRGALGIPVTVDFESGYSSDPEAVAASVCELRALGVAGINIEDGAADPQLLERKIAAIKRALQATGDDVFVNARADIYLNETLTGAAALREVVERARRYEAAGADGFFVPLVSAAADIVVIAAATALPLNVLSFPGLPSAPELFGLGVRRLSAGPRIAECAYGAARDAAGAFLEGDGVPALLERSVGFSEMNEFFSTRPHSKS